MDLFFHNAGESTNDLMEVNKRGIAAVIREVVTKQTLELYEDLEKRRTTPDKLRCLNLDSMWKRDKNKSDTQKTEEELVLWNSFNCHELLRDMTGGATDQTMQRKCLNMKSHYSVQPGYSWGDLPQSLPLQWTSDRCDCYTEMDASKSRCDEDKLPFSVTAESETQCTVVHQTSTTPCVSAPWN